MPAVISIPEIRHATPEDYEPLLNWLNEIFRPDAPDYFQKNYGHVFYGPESIAANSLILKERRQYLGHITILPLEMKTSIGTLRVGAIGQVAVDPSARGNGLMRILMESAHQEALARGCVLGFLGGIRSLYSRFGYEICGINYEWMWDRQGRKVRGSAHLMDPAHWGDVIYGHWSGKPHGICWSREGFDRLLRRPSWEAWMNDSHTACVLAHREARRMLVDGFFGDPRELQSMLDDLCEYDAKPVYVRHCAGDVMSNAWMEEAGMDIMRKGNGMIKILDARGLREKGLKNVSALGRIAGHEFSRDPEIITQQRLLVRELFGDPFDKFPHPSPVLWGWETLSYV